MLTDLACFLNFSSTFFYFGRNGPPWSAGILHVRKYTNSNGCLRIIESLDKATAGQCLQEVLPYLCGPDAVDDRVEAARKEQVHDAEENANGCRETVPDPIGQESGEYDGQADSHDHDVGDTGVQSFDT